MIDKWECPFCAENKKANRSKGCGEWQPIETAPKNGTRIFGWNDNSYGSEPYICWFGRDDNTPDDGLEEWLSGDGDDFSVGSYFTPCTPTHWMPLPPTPSTS